MQSSPARTDVTLKLNQLPTVVKEVQGGSKTYVLGSDGGLRFEVTLNKKAVKRLNAAATEWTQWLAVISGRCGEKLGDSFFRLENAGLLNVLDRTPKPAEDAAEGASAEQAPVKEKPPAPAPAPAYKPLEGARPVEAAAPAPRRRRLSPQEQRIVAASTVAEVMFKRS